MSTQTSFHAQDLAQQLDTMTDEERHELPFGVIGLDAGGHVWFYSRTEGRLSGAGPTTFEGVHFFEAVAPCMNHDGVRGRIEHATVRGTLDVEIGHTGDFADASRFFRIRAMSARNGGIWLAQLR